jgi:choline transport protein
VAFAIIILISTIQWFVDGRKNFKGPTSEMGLEVLKAVTTQGTGPEDQPIDPKLAGQY